MTAVTQNAVIQNLMPTDTSSPTYVDESSSEMGKDAFLKLLITQLQHQDPLDPMEGVEFTAQLAQFSSLEQLFSLNESFTGMNAALQAQNNYQAMDLVGKYVTADGNSISVTDGKATDIVMELEGGAATTLISIVDGSGLVVRTLDAGQLSAGEHVIEWDGLNSSGRAVDDGVYSYQVLAADAEGASVGGQAMTKGMVSGVSYSEDGSPIIMIGDLEVSLDDIVEILAPPSSNDESGES